LKLEVTYDSVHRCPVATAGDKWRRGKFTGGHEVYREIKCV